MLWIKKIKIENEERNWKLRRIRWTIKKNIKIKKENNNNNNKQYHEKRWRENGKRQNDNKVKLEKIISLCPQYKHNTNHLVPMSTRNWQSTSAIDSIVQSAGPVEYTDCFSASGQTSPNECPRYDTKQSDGEVPVL